MNRLLDWLLLLFPGCWHRQQTRPFTFAGRTYRVCLDCGQQISCAAPGEGLALPRRAA